MIKTILLTTLLVGGTAFGTPKDAPKLYNLDYPLAELNDKSIREVFTEHIYGGEQLTINADFENGTNGWNINLATGNVENGLYTITNTAKYGKIYQTISLNIGEKYYWNANAYQSRKNEYVAEFWESSGKQSNVILPTSVGNVSGIYTATANTTTSELRIIQVLTFTTPASAYVEYFYYFNLSTLITNNQYSPLYDTTFDLMTDEQIKVQMDDFIERPYQWLDFDEVGQLTDGQIDYWYEMYNTLLWFEDAEIPIGNQIIIDDVFILITGLILYIFGFILAYLTGIRWIYALSGILWFIPIFILDNIFIIVFSSAMIIISATIAFYTKE